MMEEECKNPLAWWRMHEIQFPYVRFVTNIGDYWFLD
jgi:hypothetical protein